MSETIFEKKLTESVPFPMCVVDQKGKIVGFNSRISDVFIYDEITGSDFFALTGIRIDDLMTAAETDVYRTIERNGKKFRLFSSLNGTAPPSNMLVYFYDITRYESLKETYEEERTCVCIIRIDNYDELIASTLPDMRMQISTQVDKTIRKWASDIRASIINNKSDEYVMYFQHSYLKGMVDSRFAILDEIRQIETEADFPMSLSIGVGNGGETILETEEAASAALDLALGRGGDQAVVKRYNQIDYYGGKLQTVEKTNKGKSRVIAHILRQMIEDAGRIMIMGHTNPDMDCFGAALGMARVCKMQGKEAHIVLDEVNDSLRVIYKQAKESSKYSFISGERAQELAEDDTLLIIVDTHRPGYLTCRSLIDKVGKIAIIDHHRRAADAIKDADLSYIESYASSASELVSEILQYSGRKRALSKLEAEALLGGITIDTNRFAVKTGVRTFEAAAWLRRSGADTTEVKRFFQTDMDAFRVRARSIAAAQLHDNGIATSVCEGYNRDAQIINSQVADELLNIKGVRASFVASRNDAGKTVVSARSLGALNVQVIMEKLGGGGHLTTAGAQVEDSPEEVLELIKHIISEEKE
ncbi:DHH family phosphoesterase [Hornefia butyriciproducens]|uniref:DHH family phosphoesterase n=1 Tax=Hornefia butyriciproducens TaxID=2652293 RepID=UPI002A9113EA|nr:DHH family phosphoesterase [Hornefia butyriciproducens]MDY5423713.1 DHH family phosphoesterase [Hornefia butyriciproducens]